ncbi:MAG TPA: alpha/beta fold hydrolase [Candidatus Acidoferrum sp.]|jgi:pimeloyl-ACP methyl ester carboxylesterase/predicted glycosyltransferase|nr:alpha/beta fold hydrolase [Candidatus Acidoferrum sp.]
MPVTETGTRARQPDSSGYATTGDGLRIYYEVFGAGEKTIVFLPATPISHSRLWKGQVHYLARHFRVVVYDGRGNGLSDHPDPSAKWLGEWCADDCRTVMDATGTKAAVLVGICHDGVFPSIQLAVSDPDRVLGIVAIGPGVPLISPPLQARVPSSEAYNRVLESNEGWFKYNHHYIKQNYRGFLEFFFGEMFPEAHSTKQVEDAVAYALDGRVETFLMDNKPIVTTKEEAEAICRQVRCPMLIIQGDLDNCQPFSRGLVLAELTGAHHVKFELSGHVPQARHPVRVNRLISEFAGEASSPKPRARLSRNPRALLVSSPIGLGHAWRDVAIARELRRQVPGLEVEWLAQPPLVTLLEACGETVHPASRELAPEAAHVDAESGEHELHAFEMIRRMDEILCANFMVFHDVVSQEKFDVWIGDEAWEVDHFLHENPELKTSPYVWMSDFVGFMPMPEGGEREARLVADYNAEMVEHVERRPEIRDMSIFIGDPADVVPERFGPGLPQIKEWTERHYQFSGYVLPFDPAERGDARALRRSLGLDADERLIVGSVGGSAVGIHLLRRIAQAFRILRTQDPKAHMLLVCGPRINPEDIDPVEGMEVVGYVHDLSHTLAGCDLAVVQAGLSTTMELVAARRPFIHIPLRGHFEQNWHVAHRLRRYGAPASTQFHEATPSALAEQMLQRLNSRVDYEPVESGGAARAAGLIASVLKVGATPA